MAKPIRRIMVELLPESRWMFEGGVHYRVRLQVDAGHTSYVEDKFISPDDFTSRFDWLIDQAKRTIHALIESDNQQERHHVQAQKAAEPTLVHEED